MARFEVHRDTDSSDLAERTIRCVGRGEDVVWVRNRRAMSVIAVTLGAVLEALPEVRASKLEGGGEVLVCLSMSAEWSGAGYATGRKVTGEAA